MHINSHLALQTRGFGGGGGCWMAAVIRKVNTKMHFGIDKNQMHHGRVRFFSI